MCLTQPITKPKHNWVVHFERCPPTRSTLQHSASPRRSEPYLSAERQDDTAYITYSSDVTANDAHAIKVAPTCSREEGERMRRDDSEHGQRATSIVGFRWCIRSFPQLSLPLVCESAQRSTVEIGWEKFLVSPIQRGACSCESKTEGTSNHPNLP